MAPVRPCLVTLTLTRCAAARRITVNRVLDASPPIVGHQRHADSRLHRGEAEKIAARDRLLDMLRAQTARCARIRRIASAGR